jgi:hypothetical protein
LFSYGLQAGLQTIVLFFFGFNLSAAMETAVCVAPWSAGSGGFVAGFNWLLVDFCQVLSSDIDLLHPPVELEKQKNKRKRLVQSPNSSFIDVKCQGCFQM